MKTLTYTPAKPPRLGTVSQLVRFAGQYEDEIVGRDVMAWHNDEYKRILVMDAAGNVWRVSGRERQHVGINGRIY